MDILRSFADAITRVLDRFYISSVRKDPESILYMKEIGSTRLNSSHNRESRMPSSA